MSLSIEPAFGLQTLGVSGSKPAPNLVPKVCEFFDQDTITFSTLYPTPQISSVRSTTVYGILTTPLAY
ncbi:MAG: hypothetical protein ACJAYF_004078 [Arenicella sp.]|jgi:hypothetical protein